MSSSRWTRVGGRPTAARRVAVVYLVLGAVWIALSDRLAATFAAGPDQLTMLQTWKGWAFVLLSALVIYWLIHRETRELSASESRFRSLVEQSLVGVFVLQEGRLRYVNPRLAEIFGYAPEEMLDRDPLDFVHEDDREAIRQLMGRVEAGTISTQQYAFSGIDREGNRVPVEVAGRRTEIEGREGLLGVVLDRTERQVLEEQLRRAQRMEAVGQLTGAIAHDFNNLLTAILGPLDICLGEMSEDHPNRSDVEAAHATAKRAAGLTRQLLTFSRKRISRPRPVDVSVQIGSLKEMLDRVAGTGVGVDLELEDGLPPVLIDPTHFEQVVLNLIVNARDAMPGGGTVRIRTSDLPGSPELLRHRGGLAPGAHVVVEVEDQGSGMDEDTKARIFEPFFTTKEEGTGLGLASVFGIVEQAGGFVRVRSSPGEGATFRVFLPVAEASEAVADASPPRERRPHDASGQETVLVVEDNPAVREVVVRMLERAGFQVLAAPDGEVALEMLGSAASTIDLLITDVTLPGPSGLEIVEEVSELYPDLCTLLVSGSADESMARGLRGGSDRLFLEKPFTADELLEAVGRVMGDCPDPAGSGESRASTAGG